MSLLNSFAGYKLIHDYVYWYAMKHKGVIFDLDGTLIDTLPDIAASMNKALEKNGFPVLETEAYREKVGWGIRALAGLCIPDADSLDNSAEIINRVADDAVEFYSEAPLVYTKPYPGINELVSMLYSKRIKTAVLTNKPDSAARLIIQGLFPENYFGFIKGEIRGKPRKPDPACVWDLLVEMNLTPSEIIFAGDSEVDMETAVSSGCFPLGVSWGYRTREIILKAGARSIINRPDELLELI